MKNGDGSFPQKMVLGLCVGIILHFSSAGQTGSGDGTIHTLLSRTYDTLVSGTGNDKHTVSFPQWDSRSGKLVAVRIKTQISSQYQYTLRNADSLPDTYIVKMGREDKINDGAIATPYDSTSDHTIGSFSLDPGNRQSQDPYILLDKYNHTDSITDHFDSYTGTGEFLLKYSAVTWSNVNSANKLGYYYSAAILDTTRFSLTYLYTAGEDSLTTKPDPFATIGNDPGRGMTLYPNPATDFIQIAFTDPGDWKVEIIAADGHLVQRNNFSNINLARINFSHKLTAGAYFARATDSRKLRSSVKTFLIR
ncbi:T9SS type A sorting domain-containing protein [Flavitalea flava]